MATLLNLSRGNLYKPRVDQLSSMETKGVVIIVVGFAGNHGAKYRRYLRDLGKDRLGYQLWVGDQCQNEHKHGSMSTTPGTGDHTAKQVVGWIFKEHVRYSSERNV